MTGSDAGASRIEARIDFECVLRSRTSVYRFAFGRVRTSAIVAGVCATTQNEAQRGACGKHQGGPRGGWHGG